MNLKYFFKDPYLYLAIACSLLGAFVIANKIFPTHFFLMFASCCLWGFICGVLIKTIRNIKESFDRIRYNLDVLTGFIMKKAIEERLKILKEETYNEEINNETNRSSS